MTKGKAEELESLEAAMKAMAGVIEGASPPQRQQAAWTMRLITETALSKRIARREMRMEAGMPVPFEGLALELPVGRTADALLQRMGFTDVEIEASRALGPG